MGARKPPPKLGYGGCTIKFQYQLFKNRSFTLDFILTIRQNTEFSSTFDFFVKLDFFVLRLSNKKFVLASLGASDFSVFQQIYIFRNLLLFLVKVRFEVLEIEKKFVYLKSGLAQNAPM